MKDKLEIMKRTDLDVKLTIKINKLIILFLFFASLSWDFLHYVR